MLKKLAIYFGLAVSLNTTAFAWVGGPFDGGDYSQILDDRGVYQATFQFTNGTGFAQWGSNVTSTGVDTSTVITQSIVNRTVLYHQGITFLGGASGVVDFGAKTISGVSDAASNLYIFSYTDTDADGATTTTQYNARYTAGIGWTGKITKSKPVLRFTGKGVLSITGSSTQNVPVKVTGSRRFFLTERTTL